jgi:xanthine dehydrogenase accessory factor
MSESKPGICARVTITQTWGSTPREVGASMFVTRDGFHGSIGGGTLEWRAMAQAQKLLQKGEGRHVATFSLGPDMGQCCGGRVELVTEIVPLASQVGASAVHSRLYLFGAGHVGRALVLALAPLPFEVMWIDERPSAFPSLMPGNVRAVQPASAPAQLLDAQPQSLVLVMTHSHALDLAIVDAALRNPNVNHVGLIGSGTKRARFERRLAESGVAADRIAALACPIGAGRLRSKHPAIIAASTVVQLLQWHEAAMATVHRPRDNTASA